MLTEKEAWGVLADIFTRRDLDDYHENFACICWAIDEIKKRGLISLGTEKEMSNKIWFIKLDTREIDNGIPMERSGGKSAYFYPRIPEYDFPRADFCDLMYYACED